jgi:hypothetical protein
MSKINANLDETLKINESDKGFIHVELTRRTIIPGQEKYPSDFSYVQQYDVSTFEKTFNTGNELNNRRNLNAMNVHSYRIVHDPRLTADEPNAQPQTEEKVKSPSQIKREETMARNKAAKAAEK